MHVVVMVMMMMMVVMMHFRRHRSGSGGRSFLRDGVTREAEREHGGGGNGFHHGRYSCG
jgi:hypothetical protein